MNSVAQLEAEIATERGGNYNDGLGWISDLLKFRLSTFFRFLVIMQEVRAENVHEEVHAENGCKKNSHLQLLEF